MPDTIETLMKRNLHEVFGERDGKKRREAIAQLRTEDCVFIDHDGKSHGRDALDRAVAALHQRLPSYVFSELRPVDLLPESGRLAWSYGRPREPEGAEADLTVPTIGIAGSAENAGGARR